MAGGYAMALLGAVLLQIASILDGVDGELARVRVQFSVLLSLIHISEPTRPY